MKKTVSIFGTIFLIFGSNMIAGLFPEPLHALVGVVCVAMGALTGTLFLKEEGNVLGQAIALLQKIENKIEEKEAVNHSWTNIRNEIGELNVMVKDISSAMEKQREITEKMQADISGIEKMPDRLYRMQDELTDKLEKAALDHNKNLEAVSYNFNESYKTLIKEIKKNLRNILDSFQDYEKDTAQKIENLTQQYQDFKVYNSELVEKMTLMTQEDYALLKGLFDGKKEK